MVLTVTYDVSDIVGKRPSWDAGGKAVPVEEALAGYLLDALLNSKPEVATKFLGKKPSYHIHVVNGKTLEIHVSRKTHGEVADLLVGFRRLLDVAVVVDSQLFELDRKTYRRQISGTMQRHPGTSELFVCPATDEFERDYLEGKVKDEKAINMDQKPLKTGRITIQDRARGEFFSWRTVVPYEKNPNLFTDFGSDIPGMFRFRSLEKSRDLKKETALAFPGFSFSMTPVISRDRRKMQIKLTQKVTQIVEWKKEKGKLWLPNQDEKEVVMEVPVLQEARYTSNFPVLDGWPVVAVVESPRPRAQATDKVLVLLFRATIRIEEEERAIQRGEQAPFHQKKK